MRAQWIAGPIPDVVDHGCGATIDGGTGLGSVADDCSVAFRVRLTVAGDGRQPYCSAVVMSIVKRNAASPEMLGDQVHESGGARGI
jgi:hypothetical protein